MSATRQRRFRAPLNVEPLEAREVPAAGLPDSLGAYRPGDGSFSLDANGNGVFDAGDLVYASYAPPGAAPVVGNWTDSPDGVTRLGYFKDGTWHLDLNGDGREDAGDAVFSFGSPGDTPVVGRWDGVHTRVGVFTTRGGFTGFILDANGSHDIDQGERHVFGLPGDRVLVGDWTGDGRTKVGVFRPNPDGSGAALFSLDLNGNYNYDGPQESFVYGLASDGFVVGDWNGDGRSKLGVYRSSPYFAGVGYFTLDDNGNRAYEPGIDKVFHFGLASDTYVAGNWTARPTPPPNPGVPPSSNSPGLGTVVLPPGLFGSSAPPVGWSFSPPPTTTPTPSRPVVSTNASTLVLTPNTSTNSASGVLTIGNAGPAGTVLNYQLTGSLSTAAGPKTIYADAASGQVGAGQSKTVRITVPNLSQFAAGTFTGSVQISDPTGAAAARTVPISMTVGGSGLDPRFFSKYTFKGTFSGTRTLPYPNNESSRVDGTIQLVVEYVGPGDGPSTFSPGPWRVTSASATLKQYTRFRGGSLTWQDLDISANDYTLRYSDPAEFRSLVGGSTTITLQSQSKHYLLEVKLTFDDITASGNLVTDNVTGNYFSQSSVQAQRYNLQ
jgi:hypothetical protein